MAPRLSGQTSIFDVVFFVSKSLLGIERQTKLKKFAILTRQPRNHVRILIYRTWPIDTPYVLLQDRTPISLRNSSDGTEFLHDNNLTKETKRNALESQISILKDRMDDIEEHQTRSLQSKTRKVGVYISV